MTYGGSMDEKRLAEIEAQYGICTYSECDDGCAGNSISHNACQWINHLTQALFELLAEVRRQRQEEEE